ncbi:MAG: Nudix family hydrolase [Gammaproteobacteria bacterium]|nr:Nudix family hydrolase [Gammaproteobacteria bacterium]NIR98331.1 Nudix family hydrolase [Gammaproteobacteria bacterium]NIT64078.1 Nudix family hydrolase [Gammaproteobacteria bacterium]NIV21009.1 Nudix family hydrolase [Gammaproteobacteria bacterium]NIX10406.1 Nudix family hydrolase [Gammaproteobacteria bacterium]
MRSPAPSHLPVVAAVIFNGRGEVLLSRRADHAHQGGLWEFPGGKLEPAEGPRHGLARELREELGVRVQRARPLIRVRHDYGDRVVRLDVWRVQRYAGEPEPREGQRLEWVAPDRLPEWAMPAADAPVVNAVRLPERYLVTGEPEGPAEAFLKRLERALQRGVRLVQLRAHTAGPRAYVDLARAAVGLCRRHGARILLNADPERARELDADGVHLTSRRLLALERRPLPRPLWVAASCHTRGELRHADTLGVDFAVLSAIRPTPSHPEAQALGWAQFAQLVDRVNIPVYALGGVSQEDLERAFQCGAQGIGGIRSLWET